MKEQLIELLSAALSAAVIAFVVAAIGWLRAHVKNKLALRVLDVFVKSVNDGDHDETRDALQANAAANGLEKHPAIARVTGGAP